MDVLKLSDGTTEIIGSEKDFADMLDCKLGVEARRWFENFVEINIEFDNDSYKDLITNILLQLEDVKDDLNILEGLLWEV